MAVARGVRQLSESFGVMQGRLSVQTPLGYQAFPWDTWRKEFDLAQDRGLGHIEWIVDSTGVMNNPVMNSPHEVGKAVDETSVRVLSVCADYLMDTPLDARDRTSQAVVCKLLDAMARIDAKYLIVPCVDGASVRNSLEALSKLREALDWLVPLLVDSNVVVALETDLEPNAFATLLMAYPVECTTVNYDIGNSAALGYDWRSELSKYGDRVSVLHIKDRTLGGSSVPLGSGDADLPGILRHVAELGSVHITTMQAFRDWQGVDALDSQLAWLDDLELSLP